MADLIKTAQRFYADVQANNTKDWWRANKATYDADLKPAALALLDDLAPQVTALTDHPAKTKLFRPHRDVRFSKDKTPYNTHLHMMWALDTDARQSPVYFFGIGVDYVTVGAGMMGFDKPVLDDWRKFVDLDTARVVGIMKTLVNKGYSLREPDLKRVPAPYAKDHPAGDLLRMKGITASRDVGQPSSLPDAIMSAFKDLTPLNVLLIQVAES